MLKFISYKQITTELVAILRESGHEVFYVASLDSDMDVLSVCQKANDENYILLTCDAEVAEDAYNNKRIFPGLLYVQHLQDVSPFEEAAKVMRLVQKHEKEMPYAYTSIIGNQVKIKRLAGA